MSYNRDRVGGATQETIVGVIRHTLMVRGRFTELCEKHGHLKVDNAIQDAAGGYVGVEEIGSSDRYYMAETALRFLGETM